MTEICCGQEWAQAETALDGGDAWKTLEQVCQELSLGRDGLVELTIVPRIPAGKVARAIPRIYDGSLRDLDGIVFGRAKAVTARIVKAQAPVVVDTDGEPPGNLPLQVRVLPGALVVRGIWKK